MQEGDGMDVTTALWRETAAVCRTSTLFILFWDTFSWKCVYFIFINAELEDGEIGASSFITYNLIYNLTGAIS